MRYVLLATLALSGCALFEAPVAYDAQTVRNVEAAIGWAEEDWRLTHEVLVARGASESELTSFDVRREAHVKRLKAWYAAEVAKKSAGGQPARGEVRGSVAFAEMLVCPSCLGDGFTKCWGCLAAFWHPHCAPCAPCGGRGWVRK